jgi:hypothetical protein
MTLMDHIALFINSSLYGELSGSYMNFLVHRAIEREGCCGEYCQPGRYCQYKRGYRW